MPVKFGGNLAKKQTTTAVAAAVMQVPAEPVIKEVVLPKEAPVEATQNLIQQPESVAAKVDLMVVLNDKIKSVGPETKQYGVLKKDLQLIADETGNPAEEVVFTGSNGAKAVYGAKGDQNTLNPGALNLIVGDLKKVVTMDELWGLISISQETVKTYLGEDAVAKYYTKTANTGPRTLKAIIGG